MCALWILSFGGRATEHNGCFPKSHYVPDGMTDRAAEERRQIISAKRWRRLGATSRRPSAEIRFVAVRVVFLPNNLSHKTQILLPRFEIRRHAAEYLLFRER